MRAGLLKNTGENADDGLIALIFWNSSSCTLILLQHAWIVFCNNQENQTKENKRRWHTSVITNERVIALLHYFCYNQCMFKEWNWYFLYFKAVPQSSSGEMAGLIGGHFTITLCFPLVAQKHVFKCAWTLFVYLLKLHYCQVYNNWWKFLSISYIIKTHHVDNHFKKKLCFFITDITFSLTAVHFTRIKSK